jgi:hypothetical protein
MDVKAERIRELLQDMSASTYADHTAVVNPTPGGRFAHLSKEQQAGPSAYPKMYSGPWAQPDPSGIEPPLGYSVNDLPPEQGFNPPPAPINPDVRTDRPTWRRV